MPWSSRDAIAKTKQANNPKKAKAWAEIANKSLAQSGDDASAIRIANSAVRHMRGGGAVVKIQKTPKIT